MEGSDKQAMEVTHIAQAIGIASSQIALQGASTLINIKSATPSIAIEGTSTGIPVQGTSTRRAFQGTNIGTNIAFHGTGTDFEGMITRIALEGTSTTIAHEETSSEKGMGNHKRMGRQKIKMEKMENETNLQVTFSKRRIDIFKKTHELAIMTGAEVASIVFSTAGKVYSYGNPNVEGVIERFTAGVSRPLNHPERVMKNQKNLETSAKLEERMKQLKIKKKHGKSLDQQLAQTEFHFWDTDNQNPADLPRSIEMLQKIKNVVTNEIDKQSTIRNCMYYSGEGILPPMHVYAGGKGSSSSASGSSGDFFRFTARAGGSRVGRGGSGLEPYHPCSEFYDVGTGGFSMDVGPSAFHGVGSRRGSYTVGHSFYLDGDGSGGDAYSFGGAGNSSSGYPNAMPDIGGVGGYVDMSSSSGGLGGGLSIKNESATSGDGNSHVGESNMMFTNWSDVMPPMRFGRRN